MNPQNPREFYPTPAWATHALLDRFGSTIPDPIIEPCCGQGHILNVLKKRGHTAAGFDITTGHDARHVHLYNDFDAVITNPPFSLAFEILQTIFKARRRFVALLLRLSFLEPTYQREDLLAERPPNHLIILPRISFTGDGKTDSVTCAWMVWDLAARGEQTISIIPHQAK
jgi:hypothetical protein